MQTYTTDFLNATNRLIDTIAHYRLNRRTTEHFFCSIEQTKILMRVKDRLSHNPVLI